MPNRNKPYHSDDHALLEVTRSYRNRLWALFVLLVSVLLVFTGVLYNEQIVHGAEHYAQSASKIAVEEPVEASRGILTDRNGKVLVSNRQVYTITFDTDLLEEGADLNAAILRLIQLCQSHGVTWTDNLPVYRMAPYLLTPYSCTSSQRSRLESFLIAQGWSESDLTAEDPVPKLTAETQEKLGAASDILSGPQLLDLMIEAFAIDPALPRSTARLIAGVRYELAVNALLGSSSCVFAEDVSVELISILTDGDYAGVEVGTSAVRQYNTTAAAHILGRVGAIGPDEYADYIAKGYRGDDLVGISGAEKAFESYLRGEDGKQVITTNEEGKITGELYTKEPQPGGTVALTIDVDFQTEVERILAEAVTAMNESAPAEDVDPEDHAENAKKRGAAAAVVQVGTADILALASYPSYDHTTYGEDLLALSTDPATPLVNRATNGTYAPGSTFKMVTAVAALESGVITPRSKILTKGIYTFYGEGQYQPKCWIYRQGGGSHGKIDVGEAILHSCNYFFYEVGRLTGIETLNEYARAFGLGEPTGIELGERTGVLAGPDYSKSQGTVWYEGDTLQAAIGQSDNLFTPLQLANYVATLVGGGQRYEAHLLKSVKSYDNTSLEYLYDKDPVANVEMDESTLKAVKEGMGALVTSGSVSRYFANCVVSAGAKTGSAQTGESVANGVFVCFAPFDEPEIALAIVIEKGGSGGALAASAVEILNAWFGADQVGATVMGEGTLLP